MRILLAEDDRDLNASIAALLTHAGYQVDAVFNGEEAYDAACDGYDGMILDWMMPKLDGVEALRRMRADGVHTPCLFLTARDAV
ncbi:MAG: response regulator [Clostridia bacterium]|nr:response regulator [Clostridia bacterium]